MPVTNYHTVDGEIIGESTSGVRTDYLVDALGSVTGTVNQSAQIQNTYRFTPYGALLAKTGTGADPKMQWVGSLGYRETGRRQSDYYVRARHYGSMPGMWSTKDSLWSLAPAYAYVGGAPAVSTDPSGMLVQVHGYPQQGDLGNEFALAGWTESGYPRGFADQVKGFCRRVLNGELDRLKDKINGCIQRTMNARGPRGAPHRCQLLTDNKLECLKDFCQNGTVYCDPDLKDAGLTNMNIFWCFGPFDDPREHSDLLRINPNNRPDTFDPNTSNPLGAFIHELLHACGVRHVIRGDREASYDEYGSPGPGVTANMFCNNVLTCCIDEAMNGDEFIKTKRGAFERCPYRFALASGNPGFGEGRRKPATSGGGFRQ